MYTSFKFLYQRHIVRICEPKWLPLSPLRLLYYLYIVRDYWLGSYTHEYVYMYAEYYTYINLAWFYFL